MKSSERKATEGRGDSMAMNKKEKQMVEELKTRLALTWTEPVEPDVVPPESIHDLSTGFLAIAERSDYPRVEDACSSCVSHAVGRKDKTTTQNPKRLYSTRVLALKALRHEVERHCAERLRRVDRMLEEELASDEAKAKAKEGRG